MPNYDFYNAFRNAPMRFQQFACALVSKRENCIFQRFGEGADGGIDGLYVSGEERIILQVKRVKARNSTLRSILKREYERLKNKNCTRYILVLSLDSLREEEKEKIREVIPRICNTNDILTGYDLNALLEESIYIGILKENIMSCGSIAVIFWKRFYPKQ